MPFQGRIDQGGYTPPPAVIVHWSNGAQKPLDTSKPFAGWHDSDIPRYGGGDQSLASHHVSAVGVEQFGGEADRILKKLFETQGGPDRNPTPREVVDFAVVHGGKRILGVGDWLALAGVPSPIRQSELGTVENPIVVQDHGYSHGIRRRIDLHDGRGLLVYENDLTNEAAGKGPFPDQGKPVEPTPPPKPPSPPAPPAQPNPPTKGGVVAHEINYHFGGREEFTIPAGARSVAFHGELLLGGPVKDETRSPIISTKLGPQPKKGKRRFDAGTAVINAKGGLAIEADDKPTSAGGPPLSIGVPIPFTYEWTAGVGARTSAAGREAATDPISVKADKGGVVVLGVERSDDPEADYVLLPEGSVLSGILTITLAGTKPGPVEPPVDPLPPVSSNLRTMAVEVLAKSQDATNAALALLAAIERSVR